MPELLSPVPAADLVDPALAALPEHRPDLAAVVSAGRLVVVLDDDPTGTQTVRDLPVLTRWEDDDLRWALAQGTPGFFVLTNTRSLAAADAAARVREIATACRRVAAETGRDLVLTSRGDSTLRGHFPLETDVLQDEARAVGQPADAVLLVPAYLEAGRVTVEGVHWVADAAGTATPAGATDFARDATFGYTSSALPGWVEEKSGGAVPADRVLVVTLDDLRRGGVTRVAALLRSATGGQVVAADAVRDDDLRVLAAAVLAAEAAGSRFVYRCGPSFVRARLDLPAADPLPDDRLHPHGGHGLVVVGSHVPLTTRQLDGLRAQDAPAELEVDLDHVHDTAWLDDLAVRVADALATGTVVLRTERALRTGADRDDSLAIARDVSAAVVHVVRAAVQRTAPAFVVAKGGITSSDVATEALGIRRAWVQGAMLPGIVSLWRAVDGLLPGTPYVVFAGNVGDDTSLARVVGRLTAASHRSVRTSSRPAQHSDEGDDGVGA